MLKFTVVICSLGQLKKFQDLKKRTMGGLPPGYTRLWDPAGVSSSSPGAFV